MWKIDGFDRKKLRELQRDASLGLEDIGARVGLSRNACWRRIKTMEEAGIIRARVTLLDAAKLNLGLTVFIQVRAAQHDAHWLETFARATAPCPRFRASTA